MSSLAYLKNNNVLVKRDYTFDPVGNRKSVTSETYGTTAYQYNELNQLSQVKYEDQKIQNYTYDPVGNRAVLSDGSSLINYNYDKANRMTVTGVVYDYDLNGNMIHKGDDIYSYNSENQLEQISTPKGVYNYTYDGDGNRVTKSVYGSTSRFIYDITVANPPLLVELDNTGTTRKKFILGTTVLGSVYADNNVYYYLHDGLDSIVALTDSYGSKLSSYEYDGFGAIRSVQGNVLSDLMFGGQQYDQESGLYYLRARYYDPTIGRFITQDVFLGYAKNPQSLNKYVYVYNNPINLIDPSGYSPLEKNQNSWIDRLQFGLDTFGLLPGLGAPADIISAIIYFARGDTISGGLSLFSAAPIVGDFFGGLKIGRNIYKETRIIAKGMGKTTFSVETKIEKQMTKRGWTKDSVDEAINKPVRTEKTSDTRNNPTTGTKNNDTATAYYQEDGSYVVRNDRTGDIVQVSDKNDPNWSAPWDK